MGEADATPTHPAARYAYRAFFLAFTPGAPRSSGGVPHRPAPVGTRRSQSGTIGGESWRRPSMNPAAPGTNQATPPRPTARALPSKSGAIPPASATGADRRPLSRKPYCHALHLHRPSLGAYRPAIVGAEFSSNADTTATTDCRACLRQLTPLRGASAVINRPTTGAAKLWTAPWPGLLKRPVLIGPQQTTIWPPDPQVPCHLKRR
jgi:hypothetical protein